MENRKSGKTTKRARTKTKKRRWLKFWTLPTKMKGYEMGGVNEKTLQQPSGKSVGSSIRIHENQDKGEIHLHDDTKRKKVAVPTAVFHSAYSSWLDKGRSDPLVLTDPNSKTQVTINQVIRSSGEIDIDLTFSELKIGNNLQQLMNFAQGK